MTERSLILTVIISDTLLFLFQSVKILTYREPQNPEYKAFVTDLKANAKKMFNFTVEDSLVGSIIYQELDIIKFEPCVYVGLVRVLWIPLNSDKACQ